jgi:hypothetical protein
MKIILSTKKRCQIRAVFFEKNYDTNATYMDIAERENLFGYCYFGHSASKYERRKMAQIWAYINALYIVMAPNSTDGARQYIKDGLYAWLIKNGYTISNLMEYEPTK